MRLIILLILILAFAGCEKSDSVDMKPEISKADSIYRVRFIENKKIK